MTENKHYRGSELFDMLVSAVGHEEFNCDNVYTDDTYNDTYYVDEIYEIESGKYKGYWRIDQGKDYCYRVTKEERIEYDYEEVK